MSRYWSKSAFFKEGWVTLGANFRWKGTSPTNLCWYQKTSVITFSCGIKISECSFVSSQSMRVIDGRRDRQMERITIPKAVLELLIRMVKTTAL